MLRPITFWVVILLWYECACCLMYCEYLQVSLEEVNGSLLMNSSFGICKGFKIYRLNWQYAPWGHFFVVTYDRHVQSSRTFCLCCAYVVRHLPGTHFGGAWGLASTFNLRLVGCLSDTVTTVYYHLCAQYCPIKYVCSKCCVSLLVNFVSCNYASLLWCLLLYQAEN